MYVSIYTYIIHPFIICLLYLSIHVSIHPSIYYLFLSSCHLSSLLLIIYHLPIIYLLSVVHLSSICLYQWSSTKGILLLGGTLDNVWRHLGCHTCGGGVYWHVAGGDQGSCSTAHSAQHTPSPPTPELSNPECQLRWGPLFVTLRGAMTSSHPTLDAVPGCDF